MKVISILSIGALAAISAGCSSTRQSVSATGERYPWKKNIVTTVFWVGEKPSAKQSGAESHKLMGQKLEQKLRRL